MIKRPPVDKRSVSRRDFDRLPKFQEGGFAVLNRILPSEQKKIEETAAYYDTYNDLVDKYNRELEDYKALYAKAEEDYRRAFANYQTQGQEFQRTQVDPYNAAVEQYQRDVDAYNRAYQSYLDQYAGAEQKYRSDYDAYEKAYREYEAKFNEFLRANPDYESQVRNYERNYNLYLDDIDRYNRMVSNYERTFVMSGPDAYSTFQMMDDGSLVNVENPNEVYGANTASNNANIYFTRDPGTGLYIRRQEPIRSASYTRPDSGPELTLAQRIGPDSYIGGVNNNYRTYYFNAPEERYLPVAPSEPTFVGTFPEFTAKNPTANLPTFTQQAPTFTREAPVFTGQEPEFNFTAPPPTAPQAPEMTPEELQAYQQRAQKMAGYRASGLEKAFEMGMLPEIAQYFKRGVM